MASKLDKLMALADYFGSCMQDFERHRSTDNREHAKEARAALQSALKAVVADWDSKAMFVARLENMSRNGDAWLTIPAVLALLNDCDMLASNSIDAARKP